MWTEIRDAASKGDNKDSIFSKNMGVFLCIRRIFVELVQVLYRKADNSNEKKVENYRVNDAWTNE